MVAGDEQQPFRGLEDDDGRQGVEDPGVALHPGGVQVSLGIDRRSGEKVGYSPAWHRTHRRRPLESPQPLCTGVPRETV